jgi:hypothetical protein
MSKIFNASTTDDQWSVLTDTIASTNLGILIPNQTLTFAQAQYEAGLAAWRIQSATTLQVSRYGLGVLDGQECFMTSQIQSVGVRPDDIISVYSKAPATGTSCNVLAWISGTKGFELFEATATNDTATALTTVINQQTLGDNMFNSQVQRIWVQAQDGASVDKIEFIDEMGGVVQTIQGGERGATASSQSNMFNLYAFNLAIPVGKGWSVKVTCNNGL